MLLGNEVLDLEVFLGVQRATTELYVVHVLQVAAEILVVALPEVLFLELAKVVSEDSTVWVLEASVGWDRRLRVVELAQ